MAPLSEAQRGIVNTIREFVRREVSPVAQQMEHDDEYPFELVEGMKELGLFGAIIPEEYGGLALDVTTCALISEEICRGWMSLSGILNSHLIMAYMVTTHGTQEQKETYRPQMATGEKRGGSCITEPNAGSDVQAIGAWKAIRQAGKRVPEDIAHVGSDDIKASKSLGFSSVDQNMEGVGQEAAERLLYRLDHPGIEDRIARLIIPELQIRESSNYHRPSY